MQEKLLDFKIDAKNVTVPPAMPPAWKGVSIFCDLTLTRFKKIIIPPLLFQQEAQELLDKYKEFTIFYSDGSKTTNHVGAAFVTDDTRKAFQLPTLASVFTSELYASLCVLQYIESKNSKSTFILSDSLSTLVAVQATAQAPLCPPDKTCSQKPLCKQIFW